MLEPRLSEIVLFEIPDLIAAEILCDRLRPRWVAWTQDLQDAALVLVELRTSADDLAVLLREVEEWVRDRALYAIRFHLDGRAYILEAGEAAWSAAVS